MDRNCPEYKKAVAIVRQDPRSRFCFASGTQIIEGGGDPHHVLPVSLFPEHAYNPDNIVIVHRKAHEILTRNIPEEVAKLPRVMNLLARMKKLNRSYYETQKSKLYEHISRMGEL